MLYCLLGRRVLTGSIMILSDEDITERLNSKDNIINLVGPATNKPESSLVIKPLNDTGVGKRGPQIPDMIRRLIAQTAAGSEETQADIANVFGVGIPTVSNYSRGLVHTHLDKDLQELATKTAAEKEETAHGLALDSLVTSLGLVQSGLSGVTTAKEAAKLALDMSRIAQNLKPKDGDEAKTKTLVVIAMPNVKKESQFETIDV
jgi:predicted transcriptional regulator